MARVHTIEGSSKKKATECKTFINPRNGCEYKTCKTGGRWKIQANPTCPKK